MQILKAELSEHKEAGVENVYILILIFCMSFNFADTLISSRDLDYIFFIFGAGNAAGTATCIFKSETYT